MELVELSDMLGAIDYYVRTQFELTIEDLLKMMDLTRSAFLDGSRK